MVFASRSVFHRLGAGILHPHSVVWLALLLLCPSGCSKSTPDPKPADSPYMASGGAVSGGAISEADQARANDLAVAPSPALERLASAAPSSPGAQDVVAPRNRLAPSGDVPASSGATRDIAIGPVESNPVESSPMESSPMESSPGRSIAVESEGQAEPAGTDPAADQPVGRAQLKPNLSPRQLVEYLGVADREMQEIWSRLPQIPGGREELIRLAKTKLEASRRLKNHAEADEQAKSAGARGELQALSHLASFSDLKSAQELEELAVQNLQSGDLDLVSDSRLVLIGFAIESLQNGETGAADRIVEYVDQIVAADASEDVPTLMVMGQARDALAAYGYDVQARRVRESIIDLYADSENPDLASAAEELAGNALYDETDRLLSEILGGAPVAAEQWRQAIERLLAAAPEMRSVQYLASAALQFEAVEKMDLVTTTFDAMTDTFNDPTSDAGREVRIAMAAMDARQSIVGVRFNPVLSSVDGSELSMESFAGRVVLVPFWAVAFPESLQLIGMLKQIQSAYPDEVAIVGVNLDGNDLLLQEFLEQNDLGFPSFRSKSSTEAEVANPIAAEFGIASMPFLAIVDAQGKVAAVNFTGRGIEEKVTALLTRRSQTGNP